MRSLNKYFEKVERFLFSSIPNGCKHRHRAVPMQPTEYKAGKYDASMLFGLQLTCPREYQRNEGGDLWMFATLQEVYDRFLG